ncbi:hypothetical protein GCM10010969_22170 [Saccharibacillus kuerlensis]|uniref:Uncharacterized protein n=1 Tax=Saccharibacillus kuerlensis TaxID=459527 RepID=A0ABQ2L5I9_9BACL|nr:hypothetical protein GCM10010969_22170 [Saccharibacillus kuerlensis]
MFSTLSVMPAQSISYELFYLLGLPSAGLLICLLTLRITGETKGWRGTLYFSSSAAILTLLIMAFNYSHIYFIFGHADWRTEVLLTAAIGLFSVLFSLVRLSLLVSHRKGSLFKRFPPAGLLFSAAAATMIPIVLTIAAMPPEVEALMPGASNRLAPYILLFAVAAGLTILTDRYREEESERKYLELHEKETHYMSLFAHNPDAVFALDDGGRVLDMNERAREMLARLPEGVDLQNLVDWTTDDQQDRILQHYDRVMAGHSDEIELELWISDEPTHLILTSLPILIENRFTGAYSIAKNITDSKKTQEKIRHLAYHDDLTGLTNRKYMREYVEKLVDGGEAIPFHLLFIDFDRFKKINEMFGLEFGDKVIRNLARKLQSALPEGTLLSRSTADEFIAILLPGCDPRQAARQIAEEFSLPFRVGQQMVGMTASIGITCFPEDGADSETLFKHADLALLDAQNRGGGHFSFFNRSRALENHERLILERDLQSAIEQGELVLFYQPKVDIRTGELVGLEALVRWRHSTLGMVSPLKFISIAEESGLIVPLERWVLRTACFQVQSWIREGRQPIPVAVNLSQIHLMQSDIVECILATLEHSGLDSRLLELEVTESAMMHNEEQVIAILRRLKQAGISISLDDFGTGYSSLSYLHLLPIDCLKIDRSFIKGIAVNEDSRAIVEMILTMARQLNLRIVAEGIEHEEQVELLRELHCFVAQGFYYSKPVAAEEIYIFRQLSS